MIEELPDEVIVQMTHQALTDCFVNSAKVCSEVGLVFHPQEKLDQFVVSIYLDGLDAGTMTMIEGGDRRVVTTFEFSEDYYSSIFDQWNKDNLNESA